jgi:hypothetical protein
VNSTTHVKRVLNVCGRLWSGMRVTEQAGISRALGESFTTLCHAAGLTH